MAEHNVVPHPRRHGIYIYDHDDSFWVGGVVKPTPQDITVLEGLRIQVSESMTPPASPSDSTEADMQGNHIAQMWTAQEEEEAMVAYLRAWDMHTIPLHPEAACLDIPGFAEENKMDPLEEPDLQCIAQALKEPEADIAFVKGFVQSRDEAQGSLVDTLREQVLRDYADTVFCGKTTGDPPKRGDFGEAEI